MTCLILCAMVCWSASAADTGPEALIDAFVQAWNSHDMEAFAKLYTSDATWVTTFDTRDEGRDAIVADLRAAHQHWAKTSNVTASKPAVNLLRPDVAVVQFNLMMTVGNTADPVGRTLLLVANKQDDGWKISAGQIAKPNCPVAGADEQGNVATAKRVFLEKMGAGRFDKLDEIYGAGFVAHGSSGDYTLDEDNASGKEWRKACPDLKVAVLRTVVDEDLVAVHWNAKCTNTVAAAGLPGHGGKADVDGMTFFRFKEAKIAEEWSIIDIATMMRQLGETKK